MKFAEWVTGDTRSNLEHDALARDTRRMCQEIRTYQNLVSFCLVFVVGIAYVFSIWDRTDHVALLLWYLCFNVLTIVRATVYERVRRSLETASHADMLRDETGLLVTGVAVSLWLGMSYWIVGIPGDERTVLAITVLNCVYATGATINAATQTRHLLFYLTVILGQAILFWIGFGNRTDYAMALLLSCLFVLLYTFAVRNRTFIVESVKIRLENKEHNERLMENRALVEGALESALEANRSKSHFIATVSHDMAQPVHALTYLLQSLKAAIADNRSHNNIVDKIESSVGLLERQFEGFVDLSRYDVSDLEVQRNPFDLTALCRVLVENAGAAAARNNVDIKLDGQQAIVKSDSVLVGRILGNLLDNAVKFGGDLVQLRVDVKGQWVIVEVRDTGIGISEEDLPKIFGDFVQLKYQSQSGGPGAGLGLSIVRRITDALGIDVFVQSEVGEGTVFTLLVPVEPSLGESTDRRPAVAGQSIREIAKTDATLAVPRINLHGKMILLVDDEPANTDALAGYISDLGGRSLAAATTDEALTLANNHVFDLAIVDLFMPVVDGLAVVKYLKLLDPDFPVIISTGNPLDGRVQKSLDAGAATCLCKPFTKKHLKDALTSLDVG